MKIEGSGSISHCSIVPRIRIRIHTKISWIRNTAVKEPNDRFQGINSASLYSLAGRYDNPIPIRFLAPIHCLKIPAQVIRGGILEK
jgi:hypothetical protein